MSTRFIVITLGLVCVLLFTSACEPTMSDYAQGLDKNGAGDQQTYEEGDTTTIQNPDSPAGETVEKAAGSGDAVSGEEGLAGSADGEVDKAEFGPDSMIEYDTAAWSRFEDKNFKFAVLYDPRLTAKMLDDAARSKLSPSPLAAYEFRDAASELGDLEMPIFTVRIFANPTQQTVDAWVISLKLSSDAWLVEPYKSDSLTGVKVMSTSYIAPGWSVFINHGKYIVQLTPVGGEGEAMLGTFELMK
jgi:hypothetical protein